MHPPIGAGSKVCVNHKFYVTRITGRSGCPRGLQDHLPYRVWTYGVISFLFPSQTHKLYLKQPELVKNRLDLADISIQN